MTDIETHYSRVKVFGLSGKIRGVLEGSTLGVELNLAALMLCIGDELAQVPPAQAQALKALVVRSLASGLRFSEISN